MLRLKVRQRHSLAHQPQPNHHTFRHRQPWCDLLTELLDRVSS